MTVIRVGNDVWWTILSSGLREAMGRGEIRGKGRDWLKYGEGQKEGVNGGKE